MPQRERSACALEHALEAVQFRCCTFALLIWSPSHLMPSSMPSPVRALLAAVQARGGQSAAGLGPTSSGVGSVEAKAADTWVIEMRRAANGPLRSLDVEGRRPVEGGAG